jgi:hypothetical protein
MGESLLVRKSGGGGLNINDFNIEKDFIAGENISKGDLVKFIVEPYMDNTVGVEHLQTITSPYEISNKRIFKLSSKRFLIISMLNATLIFEFIGYNEGVLTVLNSGTLTETSLLFHSNVVTVKNNGLQLSTSQGKNFLLVSYQGVVNGYNRPGIISYNINDNNTLSKISEYIWHPANAINLIPRKIYFNNVMALGGLSIFLSGGGHSTIPFTVGTTGNVSYWSTVLSSSGSANGTLNNNNYATLVDDTIIVQNTTTAGSQLVATAGSIMPRQGLANQINFSGGFNFNNTIVHYQFEQMQLFLIGNNNGATFRTYIKGVAGFTTSGFVFTQLGSQNLVANGSWSTYNTFLKTNDAKVILFNRAPNSPFEISTFVFTNIISGSDAVISNYGSFNWATGNFVDGIFLENNKFILINDQNKIHLCEYTKVKAYKYDNLFNQNGKTKIEGIALSDATTGNTVKIATI